jgi:diacylglycerol kinase family enzyme
MSRPLLLLNPRSGRRGPSPDELRAAAERLGVEVRVLAPDEDAGRVAREAVGRGATALGVAGGDGSLGGVAKVALEADVPFVPIPFGTRNHFARDVGFDRDDAVGALAAFAGDERRVDVAVVGERVFVNNVSLGVYASLVHDPRRRTKSRILALLRMVSTALGRSRRVLDLSFDIDGRTERHRALFVIVANNDYDVTAMADLDARPRLDGGSLHAYVVEAAARRTLVALLARAAAGRLARARGWTEYEAKRFCVESRRPRIHAAIDGDPVVLGRRLEFEVRPRALRVRVPPKRAAPARAAG